MIHRKTSWTTSKTSWNTLKTLWNIMKHSNTCHSMRQYRRSMRRRWRLMRRRRRLMRRRRRLMRRRRRSRGVTGNIGNCGVGVTSQMCNRVTNHGDMCTFSKPGCSDVTAMTATSQTHSQSQAHSHCDVTPVLHKQDPGATGRAA